MNKIAALIVFLMVGGCASQPKLTPEQQNWAQQPVSCKDKQECDVLWQRAQSWVAANSHWRIQIATDTLLQTYGPGEDAYSAFTITKELDGKGGANILMSARCGNIFGCDPSPIESLFLFRKALDSK